MPGPSEITLDLHGLVDKLLLLKGDLQAYRASWGDDEASQVRRRQLAIAIRQVSERAVALEDLAMHVGDAVAVAPPTRAAGEALRCAAHVMDRLEPIGEAEPFDEVLSCVLGLLHAADVVCLRAAGARRDSAGRRAVRIDRPGNAEGATAGVVIGRIGPRPSVDVDDTGEAAGAISLGS